ncbi:exosortase-associated EpsI family protein [Paludisphaera sp.]|uniref:exosortase-associated EpsI family protein n=1 Tax=Paludisphaera sp. TaxID=2017432 RepID=UPI00301BD704
MDNALIDQPAAPIDQDAARGAPPAPARGPSRRKADVRNLILVGLLLGASGAYRYWRDHQFSALESRTRDAPFALKDISPALGPWRMVEGAETTLDPRIARLAGSTDHIVRSYENEETGEKVTVLALYGPALLVFGHTPEVCYPSTGFRAMADPEDVTIPATGGGRDAVFRRARYGLFEGGTSRVNEVFHSFRNGGVWHPEMASRWKQFRYNPGMFKIQVERVERGGESGGEATAALLAALVAEIEDRLGASGVGPGAG